eukprot:TRINITY_DN56696_c0_g1_i2.p2 TRINITY_DN56696_c0_g1~~TRINITY_DN56696_c0_g1_i2.p2  ORF type:complete len:135 (-),score=17.68 TRINITY_DN56696_c0_g1_i2:42-446(-)
MAFPAKQKLRGKEVHINPPSLRQKYRNYKNRQAYYQRQKKQREKEKLMQRSLVQKSINYLSNCVDNKKVYVLKDGILTKDDYDFILQCNRLLKLGFKKKKKKKKKKLKKKVNQKQKERRRKQIQTIQKEKKKPK